MISARKTPVATTRNAPLAGALAAPLAERASGRPPHAAPPGDEAAFPLRTQEAALSDSDDLPTCDLTTASILKDAIVRSCPLDADVTRPRVRSVAPPPRAVIRLQPIRWAVDFAWPPGLTDEAAL